MPVLHKYMDRNEYYILTKIRGNIITFQLTDEGYWKLHKTGITPGQQFPRALLLDLYRSGYVFTLGLGHELIDKRQLAFDFSDDPEPEKLFPLCAKCSSLHDLHLVEVLGKDPFASILCNSCRAGNVAAIDTSIPLTLVTRGTLARLIEIKAIKRVDAAVTAYKALLEEEFESKWEAYKKKPAVQPVLIDEDTGSQKKLL